MFQLRIFTLLQSGVGLVAIALVTIVHIGFAVAVYRDCNLMVNKGRGSFLVPPGMWAAATLLGGITTAVAYWLVHYSTLRRTTTTSKESLQP